MSTNQFSKINGKNVPIFIETVLVTKDGTSLFVEIETQIVGYNDQSLHVLGFRDISNRKKMKRK